MFDSTLSNDVPEATKFRTVLLKLMTAGQERTRVEIELQDLRTSYATELKSFFLHMQDYIVTMDTKNLLELEMEKKLDSLSEKELAEVATKNFYNNKDDVIFNTLNTKQELILINMDFCNAYHYFHLDKCPLTLTMYPSDDLDKILFVQKRLLYHANLNLEELNPPPQSFRDRQVVIKLDNHCEPCFGNYYRKKYEETPQFSFQAVFYCLLDNKMDLGFTSFSSDNESLKSKVIEVFAKCSRVYNLMEIFKKENTLTYEVSLDDKLFENLERVRVEEVSVFIKGAETTSGMIQGVIETSWLMEDKFNGQCFVFSHAKWRRIFSYTLIKNGIRPKRFDATIFPNNYKVIDYANVHPKFLGVYHLPTVFTRWKMNVSTEKNPGLNLKNTSQIVLSFSGSFILSEYDNPYSCEYFKYKNNTSTNFKGI